MSGGWSLEFLPQAEDDFEHLDRFAQKRVVEKLSWLIKKFEEIIPLALSGEFKDFYKLRIGDLRVMYKANWKNSIVIVCYIDRRDKIYKKKN